MRKFAVAPMLDWTDRHCRFFHRLLTKSALLYSEMVVINAAIYGNRQRLLGFNKKEHPLAVQLGGADPERLAEAAKVCEQFGYDEINLNVGCPSDRVQSGRFGACLMLEPDCVARCVEALKRSVSLAVTVKCRIGVDDQDEDEALDQLGEKCINAGVDALWIHARKAWLKGLSPKENRDVPPINYNRVYRFKKDHPEVFVGINGGIKSVEEAQYHFGFVDGVMIGRAAYHNPRLLMKVDHQILGTPKQTISDQEIIDAICEYCDCHIANGGRLTNVTRHLTGLFYNHAGARNWRTILSTEATKSGATSDVIRRAYLSVLEAHTIQTTFGKSTVKNEQA